jgi:hypothetical protein
VLMIFDRCVTGAAVSANHCRLRSNALNRRWCRRFRASPRSASDEWTRATPLESEPLVAVLSRVTGVVDPSAADSRCGGTFTALPPIQDHHIMKMISRYGRLV